MILRCRPFYAGDIIFRQGDVRGLAYLIEWGCVDIFLPGDDPNEEVLLARKTEGEIFGEMMLIDGLPRSASARAVTDTTCVLFNRDQLNDLLDESPRFVRGLVRVLVSRLRQTNDQLAEAIKLSQ